MGQKTSTDIKATTPLTRIATPDSTSEAMAADLRRIFSEVSPASDDIPDLSLGNFARHDLIIITLRTEESEIETEVAPSFIVGALVRRALNLDRETRFSAMMGGFDLDQECSFRENGVSGAAAVSVIIARPDESVAGRYATA